MTYANEVRRKLIHLAASVFPLIYAGIDRPAMLWLVTVLVALLLVLDVGRIYSASLNTVATRILGPVLRGTESRALTGATWMAIAGLLCVLLFPKWIAIVAFLFVSVSDALAALIGRRFGRTPGRKTPIGSAAFLVSALLIALSILRQHPLAAAAGAVVATFAERTRVRVGQFTVDDNLAIALAGGGTIYLLIRSL
jgi:dolichol kinase